MEYCSTIVVLRTGIKTKSLTGKQSVDRLVEAL
jgi:hypothetical protein